MKGWKTKVGAVLIGIGASLQSLGYPEYAELLMRIGEVFGIIGVAHKIEKAGKL